MNNQITDAGFIKAFAKLCDDAYNKGWHERNGGNLSYRIKEEELEPVYSLLSFDREFSPIGITAENLANEFFLVTGSGKYFQNVKADVENNAAIIQINEAGSAYRIVWGLTSGGVPTSELPTHLINHSIKKEASKGLHRVIMHSHPANTIALTFVLPLDTKVFSRELWEMMTECPIVFPKGVGVLPWRVPGSADIALETAELIKQHDVVVWAHHGVFCSGADFDETFGLMHTVEKAAEILVKVLSCGGKRQTMCKDDICSLCGPYKVDINKDYLD